MIKDSGERREFGENGAVRDMSAGKGDMASIPWEAVLRLSKHYEEGAKKYKRWNYRAGNGIPLSSYLDSAMRHLAKYQCGCDDEDHLSAAAFNVFGAMLVEELHPDMIDLPLRKGKNRFKYFAEETKEETAPDACPIDKPCENDKTLLYVSGDVKQTIPYIGSLNDLAREQYEQFRKAHNKE